MTQESHPEQEAAAQDETQGRRSISEGGSTRRGLVVVNTGDGKGKTTAALGVVFRAWGRGMKVVVVQFIKQSTSMYGEHHAARKLDIEIISLGGGFTWLSKDIERDKALAREAWDAAKEKLQAPEYQVVVLDEITYPITYGWIPVEEVLEALRARPPHLHVLLTGRKADPALIEYADLVTEMREVKHPYKQGIKAQPGLDF